MPWSCCILYHFDIVCICNLLIVKVLINPSEEAYLCIDWNKRLKVIFKEQEYAIRHINLRYLQHRYAVPPLLSRTENHSLINPILYEPLFPTLDHTLHGFPFHQGLLSWMRHTFSFPSSERCLAQHSRTSNSQINNCHNVITHAWEN